MPAEIFALREILPKPAVGILVAATLPGAMRVTEIDRQSREDRQLRMPRHLRTLTPSEPSTKAAWEFRNAVRNRITHRLGPMSGERGSRLLAQPRFVPSHGRQVKKQGEAFCSFNQRTDGRTVQAKDQIPFPMARNSATRRFSGTFAHHDRRRKKNLPRPELLARGTLKARPVRRRAVSSCFRAPRPRM